jgi:hypothetical protein
VSMNATNDYHSLAINRTEGQLAQHRYNAH